MHGNVGNCILYLLYILKINPERNSSLVVTHIDCIMTTFYILFYLYYEQEYSKSLICLYYICLDKIF